MRHHRIFVIVLALVGTSLAWTPAHAQASTPAITVDLNLDMVRDIEFLSSSDRIVVVGDDEVQIFTRDGERTARITGVPGAQAVKSSGTDAIVAASGSGELVIIDTISGVVTSRIDGDAEAISSISVVGDTIWYQHGPSRQDAAIGKASIATGSVTPEFLRGYSGGGHIDVSPGRPESILYTRRGGTPRPILRLEMDGTWVRSPHHRTSYPFIATEAGDVAYAYSDRKLMELDVDTFEPTGFSFEPPFGVLNGYANSNEALDIYDEKIISIAFDNFVSIYDMGESIATHTFELNGWVRALNVTQDQLFAVTGGSAPFNRSDEPTELMIVPHDYVTPVVQIDVWVHAYGTVTTQERVTLTWVCDDRNSGSFLVEYGHLVTIEIQVKAEVCYFAFVGALDLVSASVYSKSATSTDPRYGKIIVNGEPDNDRITFVHEYPSVYSDLSIFVNQQYLDLLNRPATDDELTTAARRLHNGAISPAGLVSEIVDSPDFLGAVAPLSRIYLAYFSRWPDESGLSYWLNRNRSDLSLDQISDFFAHSQEFDLLYGDVSDAEFVSLVYQNVLDRSPDDAGIDYWVTELDDGLTRGELMTGFSESPENMNRVGTSVVVRSLYHGLLGREPDDAGFEFWSGVHRSGEPLEAMIASFLAGDEYFDRFWHVDESAALELATNTTALPSNSSTLPLQIAKDLLKQRQVGPTQSASAATS